MSYTYDPSSTNATTLAISRVRFAIGDVVNGSGVRPDLTNLTDAEITLLLTDADGDWQHAAAAACRAMASAWALYADMASEDTRKSASQIAARWTKQAEDLYRAAGLYVWKDDPGG